jgi:spermidine/putrescine transport system permease protein
VRVTWPLTLPGVITGSVLVFVPALGSFLTSDLLGGAKVMLIGNLVQNQFTSARNWPFGSALSGLLLAVVMVGLVVRLRWDGAAQQPAQEPARERAQEPAREPAQHAAPVHRRSV